MNATNSAHESCLGMLEVGMVPRGLRTLDVLVKEAPVKVLRARPVSPAHYVILFEGEVESVRRAIHAGSDVAGDHLVASLTLPSPHFQIGEVLEGVRKVDVVNALGVLQTSNLPTAIIAADGAAKTGEVELIELRLGMGLGGSAFFTLTGEVSSVEAAILRARSLAEANEALVDSNVIASPGPDVVSYLLDPCPPFTDM